MTLVDPSSALDKPRGASSPGCSPVPAAHTRRSRVGRLLAARSTKRAIDVLGSTTGLVVAGPVLVVVGVAVLAKMGRPVLFQQARPGKNGVPFHLYKFRTMTEVCEATGGIVPDSERLTPIGRLLRRWSLDELPELWNVLKGDMSLVGPRPLLAEYLDLYTDEQMRRHEMRPGLTGLAQVSGRNDQTWRDRLVLDVWYVDHWSLRLDLRILATTVVKVLTGEGTSAPGDATMRRFEGSRSD